MMTYGSVLVGHVARTDVEFEIGPVVFEIIVVWQFIGDVDVQSRGRFVGPTPGHVSDSVSSSAQHE